MIITKFIQKLLAVISILLISDFLHSQYLNIKISNSTSTDPEEVSIAINPQNPLNLAAAANLDYFYYSTNGGFTWVEKHIQSKSFGVWGDPCVIFDVDGNLYYSHLSNTPTPGYWVDRIVVQKSTNGGISWDDGKGIGFNSPKNQDKEWLAVDYSNSKYRNNLYLSWTEFDKYESINLKDSSRILFSHSTNSGETWSSPVRISDIGGSCLDDGSTVEGAVPCVGPNGEIYISWAGPLGIMFDKSIDGGSTFGKDVFVTTQPGGWAFNVSGISRCNGLPITASDNSNSVFRGNIYVLWSDQRNSETNTDIFIIKSTDSGKTWGKVIKVNDDISNRQQFFPWMSIDQSNGYIYIVFYDRRNTTGDETDVYMAKSSDGGETFTNFKVSESSFIPFKQTFFGDYTNIATLNGKIYPIWMRMDNSKLSIWTAIIKDNQNKIIEKSIENTSKDFQLFQNYPNPFNPSTEISYFINRPSKIIITISNIFGEIVKEFSETRTSSGSYRVKWDGTNNFGLKLSSGIYFCQMNNFEFKLTKKMMLLR